MSSYFRSGGKQAPTSPTIVPAATAQTTQKPCKEIELEGGLKFKVGDVVELELSLSDTSRWDMNVDRGGSGKWSVGEVVEISNHYNVPAISISFLVGRRYHIVNFPLPGHLFYMNDQWSYPGYLRHAKPTHQKIVCECGAKHTSFPNLHLSFCQLYSAPFGKK